MPIGAKAGETGFSRWEGDPPHVLCPWACWRTSVAVLWSWGFSTPSPSVAVTCKQTLCTILKVGSTLMLNLNSLALQPLRKHIWEMAKWCKNFIIFEIRALWGNMSFHAFIIYYILTYAFQKGVNIFKIHRCLDKGLKGNVCVCIVRSCFIVNFQHRLHTMQLENNFLFSLSVFQEKMC